MFYTLLTVLIVLVSLALVFVVLVQKSKGGGLASGFASSNNIMGVRKTTDFLEKATWWLFGIVAVLCVASAAFLSTSDKSATDALQQQIEQKAVQQATTPSIPAFGGDVAATPAEPAQATTAPAVAEEAPADSVQ